MIKDIVDELNRSKSSTEVLTHLNLGNNMFLNKDLFKEKMENLDIISDDELRALVKQSYKYILEHIYYRTDKSYVKSFSDERFLRILIQVLSTEPRIDMNSVLCCNKLAYDYLTYSNANPTIRNLFFSLSKVVNRDQIYPLLSLNLSEDLAAYLLLARNSSENIEANIKRVNFLLMQQKSFQMTTTMLIRIYEKLFLRNAKDLFIYTITDVYNFNDEMFTQMQSEDPDKYSSYKNIYYRQADAVIAIINSLEMNNIIIVVRELSELCSYKHYTANNVLYSLRSIATTNENARFIYVVEWLEKNERCYVV